MLPAVDKVLMRDELVDLIQTVGHDWVKLKIQSELEQLRKEIICGGEGVSERISESDFLENLCHSIIESIEYDAKGSLVSVFNLTGTVIHTNLGRAGLTAEAIIALQHAAVRPLNLEYDLETGARGDRDSHIESIICELTGAEAATVVNNNAAAVVLVLNSLAKQRDVLISRGELVEIGGAFRIPEVMQSVDSHLVEVGTTNRTHLADYEMAISERTALLMKVHTSNYEIRGFTSEVAESELAKLAHAHELPFVSDLGSGTLLDMSQYGLPREQTVKEVVQAGADLVCFSGDKLLGGPQAGLIVGRKDLIARLKKNPLKRALRVDKITLAALQATLSLYRNPETLSAKLPILMDLTRSLAEIDALAMRIQQPLSAHIEDVATVEIVDCHSQIGSGALPLDLLESKALKITPRATNSGADTALRALAHTFRSLPRPVIGRLHDGSLYLDLRCLRDEDEFVGQLKS